MIPMVKAVSMHGEYLAMAEMHENDWISADKKHPGALIRHYDLESLISFWLSHDPDIASFIYDADGHHNISYPDHVINNQKARLVVQELER